MKNKGLKIFTYSVFKDGSSFAASLLGNTISQNADKYFNVIYYASSVQGENPTNIQLVNSKFTNIIRGILTKLYKLTKPPHYKLRFFTERLYDYAATFKIEKNDIIIAINPPIYKTLRKSKSLGGINFYIAGNPSDTFILDVINKYKTQVDYEIKDAYTYLPRVKAFAKFIDQVDYIICLNQFIKQSFEVTFPHKKTLLIPGHFPPHLEKLNDNYHKSDNIFRVSYIAYSVFLKGLHTLLEAWEKLELINSELIIGGDIEKDLLIYIKKKYKNTNNIKFEGYLNSLNAFYRNSSVFVCPSLIDACPGTIIEAMFCGIPTIASTGCGNSNLIIDGNNGYVFDLGDSTSLAEKIKYIYENQYKLEEMGKNAKATILNLVTQNELANNIMSEINKLTNHK